MMKTVKYIIATLSVIIIISLAIPFFISVDSYKSIIAEQVKEHTGRDLKIDGNITFAILPFPQIKLNKVTLSSLPGAKAANLIEVDFIEAKLLLPPLFDGKIVIDTLELNKPIINLEKLAAGKATWELQTSSDSAPKPSSEQKDSAAADDSPFTISDIRIKSGKLQYIDRGNVLTVDNLDLDVTIPSSGGPLSFKLDLALAATNLSKLPSSPSSGAGSAPVASSGVGGWPKSKIDLSALSGANGTISLKMPKLIAGSLSLDNLAMKAKLNDGVLTVNSLAAGLYGGNLEGEGSISGKGSQPVTVNFALKNAILRNIVAESGKIKIIDGALNVACDLQTQGVSQFDYINNLRGNINVSGKNGKISGMDLQKITQALNKPRDLVALGQSLGNAFGKGETVFSNLSAETSVSKGVMNITKCEFISNETSTTTTGWINLPQYSLDTITIINSGVKNFPPVQVRFYGSLDNPQNKIDVKAIWEYLAKNALTGVIENLKQGKTNPKDLINGLLGGGNSRPNDDDSKSEEVQQDPNDAAKQLLQKGLKGLFK
jgi:uncharacterized protein involved in outer membrane biogenesis